MTRGFSLIEILIAISILSGVVLAVSLLGFNIFDFSIFLGQDIIEQQEIQITIRIAVSEMRAMAPSVSGAYPIESASQNSLTFYSDLDGDGLTEKIRYFLDSNTFKKGVIKPSGNPLSYPLIDEKITESVHDIYIPAGNIFSYYDANYSGSQSALAFPVSIPSVRLIKVSITADQNPNTVTSRINFYSEAELRNIQ